MPDDLLAGVLRFRELREVDVAWPVDRSDCVKAGELKGRADARLVESAMVIRNFSWHQPSSRGDRMNAMHAVRELDRPSPDRILITAERLIGEFGLDGVSLRQISQAAGLRNNYAVQYHFNDLAGLVAAIRAKRLPQIEALRASLFAEAAREGKLKDTRTMLDILYRPLIDLDGGDRCHARFVLALHNAPTSVGDRRKTFESMPLATQAVRLLCEANPWLAMPLLLERLRLTSFMVLSSVLPKKGIFGMMEDDSALVGQVIDMAAAALCAPVSKEVAALVELHEASSSKCRID